MGDDWSTIAEVLGGAPVEDAAEPEVIEITDATVELVQDSAPEVKESEGYKSIWEHLFDLQYEICVPKDNRSDQIKYKWRTLGNIEDAIREPMHNARLLHWYKPAMAKLGDRYYSAAWMYLMALDTGETIRGLGFAREPEHPNPMSAGQMSGAINTYAAKYAAGNLLCLETERDLDSFEQQPNLSKADIIRQKLQAQGLSEASFCPVCPDCGAVYQPMSSADAVAAWEKCTACNHTVSEWDVKAPAVQ